MTASAPASSLNLSLARFQDDFARTLLATDDAVPATMAALVAQPAFAVYRNTVLKGCIDALQANYPAVNRLVGDEWLRAAASLYARDQLPTQPMLLQYGASFAEFLERFEPAAELPYLPGVARLDRCWTEAHAAVDEPILNASTAAQLAAGNFFRARLQPHPAARWVWFADAPIYTIWARNRGNKPMDTELEWRAEGALLTRPRDAVQWIALNQAGCALLDACAAGATVADATRSALDIDTNADLAGLLTTLLDAGAFSSRQPCGDNLTEEQK